jgi:hypothetical protein
MFVRIISFVLLFGLEQMTMSAAQRNCQVSENRIQAMLAADYDTFDQSTSNASWRPLMSSGCYSGAATVISRYLEANHSSLTSEQIRTLYFHAGQTLAFADQNQESIRALEHAKDSSATADWNAYVDATVAFLKHDRGALVAARNAYARVSKPNSARGGVIEGLLNCLGKTYTEGVICSARPGPPTF